METWSPGFLMGGSGYSSFQLGGVDGTVRLVLALGQDPGLVVVEFFLDNDMHRPIQSELVLAEMRVFFSAFDH